MSQKIVPVSEVVRIIKSTVENDVYLQHVAMSGELSNYTIASSGHWYFTLKDSKARLSCVMFSNAAKRISTSLKEGDQVIVFGRISVYEASGSVQCYVIDMQLAGIGDLYAQLEKTRKKLAEEGLFDLHLKKAIPQYPHRIALVTSIKTAAYHDVMSTLQRRWPYAEVDLFHTAVQGQEAIAQIKDALLIADKANADVILLVRGGGSIEDLWCFNDESIIRTIALLSTPIISGVGHESDITLVDYVTDKRAPTPTGAAELATPNIQDVRFGLAKTQDILMSMIDKLLQKATHDLGLVKNHRFFLDPSSLTAQSRHDLYVYKSKLEHAILVKTFDQEKIKNYKKRIHLAMDQLLKRNNETLKNLRAHHGSLSLDSALQRGYSITMFQNRIIESINDVTIGDSITTKVKDGVITSTIENKKEHEHDKHNI